MPGWAFQEFGFVDFGGKEGMKLKYDWSQAIRLDDRCTAAQKSSWCSSIWAGGVLLVADMPRRGMVFLAMKVQKRSQRGQTEPLSLFLIKGIRGALRDKRIN